MSRGEKVATVAYVLMFGLVAVVSAIACAVLLVIGWLYFPAPIWVKSTAPILLAVAVVGLRRLAKYVIAQADQDVVP